MIEQYTSKLQNKQDLSFDEISQVMEDILKGAVPDEKTATFLKCLREKGESDESPRSSALQGPSQRPRRTLRGGEKERSRGLPRTLTSKPLHHQQRHHLWRSIRGSQIEHLGL